MAKRPTEFFELSGLQSTVKRFKLLLDASEERDHVLIRGPRGVGKSYFVEIFKEHTGNLPSDIVHLNCASIHPETAESELFGHVKGAFTGANTNQPGFIEEAAKKGGVIILEELNSLSSEIQAKLLVFMDHFFFYPLGSRTRKEAEVRIVCTMNYETNIEIRQDIVDRFRITISVPPLSERRPDIIEIIDKKFNDVSFGSLTKLCIFAHNWPGNIRQLEQSLFEYKATGIWPNGIVTPQHRDKLGQVFQKLAEVGLSKEKIKQFFPIYLPEIEEYLGPFKPRVIPASEVDNDKPKRHEVDALIWFFALIYGRKSLTSPCHILEIEPFSNESLHAVKTEMARVAGLKRSRDLVKSFADKMKMDISEVDKDGSEVQKDINHFVDFIYDDYIEVLSVCEQVCRPKSLSDKNRLINADQVALYLIEEEGRFEEVFRACFHKLGFGAQVRLAKIFGRGTSTINRWCKEFGLT